LPQPQTLLEGKYEILSKLREGGMGTIYRVRHRLLDQVRVIKVMRAHVVADPDLRRRFTDEARTATRLNHPNLCTIYDFALDEDGTGYLVMEFIDGVNLAELLTLRGSPGLALTLEIAHQSLLALAYLHQKGIVHRDIAPDNLMLTRDEKGRPLVKLIDLGIAKAADRTIEATATGVFLGKLKYASPEQYGSLPAHEKLDGRSDLYGLGVVLYELLTGVRPFAGDTPGELLRAHLFEPPLPFAESDPSGRVPPDLRQVILKVLEKRREDRYPSAEAFHSEIVQLQRHLRRPEDLEETRAILASLPRLERVSRDHVTPSAQDRLDRHFGAHTTPRPSDELLTVVPTVASEAKAPAGEPGPTLLAEEGRATAGRRRLIALAAGMAVVLGLVLLLRERVAAPAGAPGRPLASPALVPTSAAQPAVEPTPRPAVAEPTAAPSPEPVPPTSVPAAPEPAASAADRAALAASRSDASRARRASERAKAPQRAADSYARAHGKEREGQRLADSGREVEARTAFDLAARLYGQSEVAARSAPAPIFSPPAVSTSVPAVPPPPPPAVRAEPTRAAAAAPERETAPQIVPSPPPRPAPSEQDRIRDAVHRYEKAQSALDADLYVRVFPSVDRGRVAAAFENFRSQSVEFEIRRIQLEPGGTRAEVFGYEKRLAVPRAGSEQRINAERTMRLEKRGDSWVITELR